MSYPTDVTTTAGQSVDTGPIVQVFDTTGIDHNGPVSVGGPRQRRLLALMAIRPNAVLTIDWISEYLWGDDDRPDEAAPALRTYVSRLRRALPEEAQAWIDTEPAGYRFSPPDDALEHRQFATLRARARDARDRDDPLTAQRLLDAALGMWRGEPFRELEDLDWARPEIEQLRADRLEMLEERWDAALALGRHTQITGELAAFTAEHGDRDRATRQYALALHRSGRTADALRVIQEHRRRLAQESGLDPSSAIAELETALLRGDPSLDVEKVGRPLRGYRLLEQIGSGAFALVWRGVQPSVNREVAVKQIRAELASRPEFIRRFEAEAHLVARIEHPHVVPLIDYWRDPDSAYLVMRWLRGGTLERLLDDGAFGVERTLTMARQVGGALAAAHAQGVVHRDVKASNILFDETGNAYLSDFGIALEVAQSSGPEAALSPGSPAYASPEQLRREPLGPQADVFSLGVVIFECLVGSLPFPDAGSATELTRRQLETPYPSLAQLLPEVPRAVAEAVSRATQKDPAERFPSMDAFLAALEADSPTSSTAAGGRAALTGEVKNPYKGLRAFDGGDVDDFFGRESLVAELAGRMAGETVNARCVAVVGPSGSGKSSVVRAGLTPALRAGAVPGSADWFVTTMVPGADPFESLEAALLRVAVNPPPSLLDQLRDGERGILRAIRRCLDSDDDRVLVVIDQFEELFTAGSPEDAHAFLTALSVAVEDPTSPLRLVLTLRADYYDRPLEHPVFARIIKEAAIDVTPLAPDELEQVIVGPARRLGVEYEPGLVARITAETVGQPSPLPLLQYTLAELFERRNGTTLTVAAYDELGKLSGALAAKADALYERATDSQKGAIRRLFGRLVNPGEQAADLRRRVPVADMGDDDATSWALDEYGAARLLTFDRDTATREPTVEVAHEALLREWPRLVTWLREDLDVLRSAELVAAAATTWADGGRERSDLYRGGRLESAIDLAFNSPERLRPLDTEFIESSRVAANAERNREQARVRRLRRLVVGIGAALVLALIAGGLALRAQQRADDEAQRAEESAGEARAQTAVAEAAVADANVATLISRSGELSADEPAVSLLLALEANRRDPGPDTEAGLLNALSRSSLGTRVATFEPFPAVITPGLNNAWAPDGLTESVTENGRMFRRDLVTGEVIEVGVLPEPDATWVGDQSIGRSVVQSLDRTRLWLGPYGGPFDVMLDTEPLGISESPTLWANRLILQTTIGTYIGDGLWEVRGNEPLPDIVILDATTGEPVGPGLESMSMLHAVISSDGAFIAISTSTADAPEQPGVIRVLAADTGEQVFEVPVPAGVSEMAFDGASGELLAVGGEGQLLTIDLAEEAVVAEVATNAGSGVVGVGVIGDGSVVVVSNGLAELVDRRAGPIPGTGIELRDAIGAMIRVDGKFLVFTSDARQDVHDFDGGALAELSVDVPSGSSAARGSGDEVVIDRDGAGVFERMDLATGTTTPLFDSGGDLYIPERLAPDGVWAVAPGANVLVRGTEGEVVEEMPVVGPEVQLVGGVGANDLHAYIGIRPDNTYELTLVDTAAAEPGIRLTITESEDACSPYPAPDGGLYAMLCDGRLRTYDASGGLTDELETGLFNMFMSASDETSGLLAWAGAGSFGPIQTGAVIIDPATGDVQVLPDVDSVANLTFARNGALLAVLSPDGTLRLWDVEEARFVGTLWDGTGADLFEPLWYDEASDALWLSTEGRLVRLPLSPDRWVARACELAGRDFTEEEWDRFVPGDEPLQSACT